MRGVPIAVLLGLVLAGNACAAVGDGTTTAEPSPHASTVTNDRTVAADWAATAVAWRAAFYEAGAEGRQNVVAFLDEDVVFEDRLVGGVVRGREDYLRHGRSGVGDIDISHPLAMFLSADGFLDQYYWVEPAVDLLDRVEMEGAVATTFVAAGSIASGRVHVPDRHDFDAFEHLADRYVSLWNEGGDAASLYDEQARIDDTLLGLSASGDDIAAVVGSGSGLDPAPLRVVDLPPHGDEDAPSAIEGSAIYVGAALVDRSLPVEVHIVLQADDGSGCPGLVAVSLDVVDDRIVNERRYHEVAAVRRCRDVAMLQPGWWEDIDVPDPVAFAATAPMVWPERDLTVQIFNGTPEIPAFVRWGLERFEAANLPLPRIRSVTFLVKESSCREYMGLYDPKSGAAAVILCRTADQTCADAACTTWQLAAQHTLLHEYAHAWMNEHLDETTRDEFLRFAGLARWNDPGDEWGERGMERAADAIAYGLLGVPEYRATRCQQSLEGFRLLTERDPLTSCP
jgi:hypothetical protein